MRLKPLEWQDTYCIIPASDLSYTDAVDSVKLNGKYILYISYHIGIYDPLPGISGKTKIIASIINNREEVVREEVSTVEEGKAFVEEWRTNYYNDLICALYDTVSDRNK